MKLTALALLGLVALAPATLAQESTCQATKAVVADGACTTQAERAIPLRVQLAVMVEQGSLTGLVVGEESSTRCTTAALAEKLVRESLTQRIAAHCGEAAGCEATLASYVDAKLAKGVCAANELAALVESGRVQSIVVGDATLSGQAAVAKLQAAGQCAEFRAACRARFAAELAAAKADGAKSCESEEAALASAGGDCSKPCDSKGAALASATGDCSKPCESKEAALASAGGDCAKPCDSKGAALASATGDCSKPCESKEAALASAGGDCAAQAVTPACAQLAALFRSDRVAGVVVDGKAYLGSRATEVVKGLVAERCATRIKAACAESAKCDATLAANVQKTLGAGICVKTELTELLASGAVDSLIVGEESATCEKAGATLAKIAACPVYQADCRAKAGAETAKATLPLEARLAALIDASRVNGVMIDGKAYTGCEARCQVEKLVRASLASSIKEHCAESRACEATLASNVDKAMASGEGCAGSQLAALFDCGKLQSIQVGDAVLRGDEAKAAIQKMMSCQEYQATCRSLASAKAAPEACEGSNVQ